MNSLLSAPVPLIAGNWKMNGLAADLDQIVALAEALRVAPAGCRVAVCPPATLLERASRVLAGSTVALGAQDCRPEPAGAFTGSLSAEMLRDAGAALVILGHSERRAEFGESDALVAAKVEAALRAGLEPIVCVGETLAQREAGKAIAVVRAQVLGSLPLALASQAFAVAYEPVWAIGTGLTPTLEQIKAVHRAVRDAIVERLGPVGHASPILYGGSVKPGNATQILAVAEVGGALVGGAALKASDFMGIIGAA